MEKQGLDGAGRQAGTSSLHRVTSEAVPCGGSGVYSGGHDSASLLNKPGFLSSERILYMQYSLFSRIFEAYV